MLEHPKHIYQPRYFNDLKAFKNKVEKLDIDCMVCLKRSGFLPGAYISFQTNIPLFTTSELDSIPEKFTKILLIDDKVYSGRSIKQWLVKLIMMNKQITTAALYIQSEYKTDIFGVDLGCQHTMWYELDEK